MSRGRESRKIKRQEMARERKEQKQQRWEEEGTTAYLAHKRRRARQRAKVKPYIGLKESSRRQLGMKSAEASLVDCAFGIESVIYCPFETNRRKH